MSFLPPTLLFREMCICIIQPFDHKYLILLLYLGHSKLQPFLPHRMTSKTPRSWLWSLRKKSTLYFSPPLSVIGFEFRYLQMETFHFCCLFHSGVR